MSSSPEANYIALLNSISNNVNLYMSSVLFALGMISCISILFVFSQREFRRAPCTIYVQTKAIFDIISLFVGVVMRAYTGGTNIDPSRTSEVWCRLRTSLLYISALGSLSCICLSGFDRWMSTSRSARKRAWSSRRVAYYATAIVIIVSTLYAGITMAVMFAPVGTPPVCSYVTFGYADYASFFFFPIFFGLLPIVIPAFFGILTYRNLGSFLQRTSRIERQLTRILLLQLMALTLASIPYAIYYFYVAATRRLTKSSLRSAQENLFMAIIRNFFYINHAYSFYIFILSSAEIRIIFKRLILRLICQQRNMNIVTPGPNSVPNNVPRLTTTRSRTIPTLPIVT